MRVSPDPDLQLARDLPLLERLEAYRTIEDAEFVRRLAEANVLTVAQTIDAEGSADEQGAPTMTRFCSIPLLASLAVVAGLLIALAGAQEQSTRNSPLSRRASGAFITHRGDVLRGKRGSVPSPQTL